MIITKPWGYEKIIIRNGKYVIKLIRVLAGHRLSLQYHEKKQETIMYKDGSGSIEINGQELPFKNDGDLIHVFPKQVHRIKASEDEGLLVVEVSTPELDDVVRIEDDFGRG